MRSVDMLRRSPWPVFFGFFFFFFQAEDGIRDHCVTGVQTCALPISPPNGPLPPLPNPPPDPRPRSVCASPAALDLGRRTKEKRQRTGALQKLRAVRRSEERRVGKECRSRGSPQDEKKNKEGQKRRSV